MAVVALCGLLGAAGPADAVLTRWAYMVPFSGPAIYQWELARMIDQSFDDGTPNDGTVATPMSVYFTQCYGGNWLVSFDDTRSPTAIGFGYDTVAFTQASTYSANAVGKTAEYGGYHVGASAALTPSTTSQAVHDAGVATKDPVETPLQQGLDRPIAGDRTWVAAWAGKPHPTHDIQDLQNITDHFEGQPDLFLTELVGNGTGFDLPATKQDLESVLAFGGGLMIPGDAFVLFVTDHGGEDTVEVAPAQLDRGSQVLVEMPFNLGQRLGVRHAPAEPGTLRLALLEPLAPEALAGLHIVLNDETLEASRALLDEVLLPDGMLAFTYTLFFDKALFDVELEPGVPLERQVFMQDLTLRNDGPTDLVFAWIALGPGPVSKVPEPTAATLLGTGLLSVGLRRMRTWFPGVWELRRAA